MLFDLHTHILPGADDGAADLSESLALLKQEELCGVGTVVLTPHFKPQLHSPQEFFATRSATYQTLKEAYDGDVRLVLGAEVLYSQYLAGVENVHDFCIEGTDYLLLEMPYHARFDERVVHSVLRLLDEHRIRPILAHVERYEAVRRDYTVLDQFREFGCLFQINAASVLQKGFSMRRFMRRLIEGGYLDLLATDCHDPKHRPAALKGALDALESQYGPRIRQDLMGAAEMVLSNQRW